MSEFDLGREIRFTKPPFVGTTLSEFHAFSEVTDSGVIFSDKKFYKPGDPMPITNFWTIQGALSFANLRAEKCNDEPILLMSDLHKGNLPSVTDIYVGSLIIPQKEAEITKFFEITDSKMIKHILASNSHASSQLRQLASPVSY